MIFSPNPNTMVRLLSVPIDNTQKNQIYFSSLSSQSTYFLSKVRHTYNNCTYQRKDGYLRIPANIETIYDINYCMYQNANFGNKWFYAFITELQYVNDGMTYAKLETDVFQTWLFDTELKESFVQREMAMDDSIGANLVDEGLETGEYTSPQPLTPVPMESIRIILASTLDLNDITKPVTGGMYGSVYSGVKYYAFDTGVDVTDILNPFLAQLNSLGKIDAIVGMFMLPAFCVSDARGGEEVPTNGLPGSFLYDFDKNSASINGYTPKNKKLLCYPYNFLKVSNNNGNAAVYKYEFFNGAKCNFWIFGNICPNPTIYCVPYDYKINTTTFNNDEKISVDGFPLCSWNNDVYAAWLAQNSATMGISALSAGVSMASSVLTGNPIGAASGAVSIAQELGQVYQHKILPPHAHGSISSNGSAFSSGYTKFTFYAMQITPEFAKRIDDYFDMFGYKTNMVKIPNISGRPYWNYVKTIDVNITGDIPNDDMEKLKAIYNNGVTIWKNGDNVGDYSLNNH